MPKGLIFAPEIKHYSVLEVEENRRDSKDRNKKLCNQNKNEESNQTIRQAKAYRQNQSGQWKDKSYCASKGLPREYCIGSAKETTRHTTSERHKNISRRLLWRNILNLPYGRQKNHQERVHRRVHHRTRFHPHLQTSPMNCRECKHSYQCVNGTYCKLHHKLVEYKRSICEDYDADSIQRQDGHLRDLRQRHSGSPLRDDGTA